MDIPMNWLARFSSPKGRFLTILFGIALLFIALRLPALHIPMERDEGEYATIGLGMLHGIPPYLDGYTMKFPGGAAMYALAFAILGPSAHSIHLALMIVNALTLLLIGFLGRRLAGPSAGWFAAAAFGTLTIGLGVYGLWLSAEHFVAFYLVAGALILTPHPEISSDRTTDWKRVAGGSLLLGLAILCKHHAFLPAFAWLVGVLWPSREMRSTHSLKRQFACIGIGFLGLVLPLLLTAALMTGFGLFKVFWFWTILYASRYASSVSISLGWEHFKLGAIPVFTDAPFLWIMAFAGWIWLLFHPSISVARRPLLLAGPASLAAAATGLMFRGQYFIIATPFAALLAGIAWHETRSRLPAHAWIRRAILTVVIVTAFMVLLEPVLRPFYQTPDQTIRFVYGMNPFPEYTKVAQRLARLTSPEERIAVLGSEPSLYFLADRRPAHPYLCVYEMMKPHPYAATMQQEIMRLLEKSPPRAVVLIHIPTSWGITPRSDRTLLHWIRDWLPSHYTLDAVVDLVSENKSIFVSGTDVEQYQMQSPYSIRIYVRKEVAP